MREYLSLPSLVGMLLLLTMPTNIKLTIINKSILKIEYHLQSLEIFDIIGISVILVEDG